MIDCSSLWGKEKKQAIIKAVVTSLQLQVEKQVLSSSVYNLFLHPYEETQQNRGFQGRDLGLSLIYEKHGQWKCEGKKWKDIEIPTHVIV